MHTQSHNGWQMPYFLHKNQKNSRGNKDPLDLRCSSSMDNDNVRLEAMVRVGRELLVFETHVLGLLKVVALGTTAGAL